MAFDTIPDANYAKHRAMEAIRNDDFKLAIMLLAMTIALTIQPKAKKKTKKQTKKKSKSKAKSKANPTPTTKPDRPAGSKGKNDEPSLVESRP